MPPPQPSFTGLAGEPEKNLRGVHTCMAVADWGRYPALPGPSCLLFSGLDCCPGQRDLFQTDGPIRSHAMHVIVSSELSDDVWTRVIVGPFDDEQAAAKDPAQASQPFPSRWAAEIPELAKAIAQAKRSRATLVVAKLDRLARSVAFTSALVESGVEFIACDNPNANRLTIHILAAVAEDEARRISERTKTSRGTETWGNGWFGGCESAGRSGRSRCRRYRDETAGRWIQLERYRRSSERAGASNADGEALVRRGGAEGGQASVRLCRREQRVDRQHRHQSPKKTVSGR